MPKFKLGNHPVFVRALFWIIILIPGAICLWSFVFLTNEKGQRQMDDYSILNPLYENAMEASATYYPQQI